MTDIRFTGVHPAALAEVLAAGVDHGGNPIESYVDVDGGWPMRCCLGRSKVGEEMALIAWSPFEWDGPYKETGPIFVHTSGCAGQSTDRALPPEVDATQMVLRPYTPGHRIAYHHVRHVPAGESLTRHLGELLDEPDVDFVHARNVVGGCYAFEAKRAG